VENGRIQKTIKSKTGVRQLYKSFEEQWGARIDLCIMLQDWDDPYNVGGLFRVADACGASELILTGKTPTPPHPQIHVTSMGHHRRVNWRHEASSEEAAKQIKAKGFTLVTVEIAEGALPYFEFEWPEKTCLVLGNEVNGIYKSVMQHRDAAVYIPQFGKGRSMNVHVTAAIVAFHALLVGKQ